MNKLSGKHFIFFIIGVAFISLKTYPSIFIDLGGRDTWLCALIASIVFIIYFWYIIKVCRATNTYNINHIFTSSLGKIFGNIFLVIFSFGLILAALESASVEANAIHSTFFLETPVWYALIFFLAPSVFLLSKNIRTLLIFILISVSSLLLNSLILLFLTQSYITTDYILPVLSSGFNKDLILTSIQILGSLCSFAVVLPFLKKLNDTKSIKKDSIAASLIISIIVVISLIEVIAFFGPVRAANIFYPEFVMGQRIQLAGFVEFGELFFLYQTVVGYFIKYIITSYAIMLIFKKYVSYKKIFILLYTSVIFVVGTLLGRSNFALYELLKYYQYINIGIFLILPLIVFSIHYIKARNKSI
ncbi:MAG: endospore germination permease [Clostridium sp.]